MRKDKIDNREIPSQLARIVMAALLVVAFLTGMTLLICATASIVRAVGAAILSTILVGKFMHCIYREQVVVNGLVVTKLTNPTMYRINILFFALLCLLMIIGMFLAAFGFVPIHALLLGRSQSELRDATISP